MYLSSHDRRAIAAALAEDVGSGDLSAALLPATATAEFSIVAREPLTACGLPLASVILALVSSPPVSGDIRILVEEGEQIDAGTSLIRGTAPAPALLTAERTILNYIRQLCAVATFARRMNAELEGTGVKLLDTRKTIPGMRGMQKYAARIGGAVNHRFGLFDGVMLKDNHIALYGSIAEAVAHARRTAPLLTKIEVECDRLEQVRECLETARPDVIMLDNMSCEEMTEATEMRRRLGVATPFEASGNVTLSRLKAIAATGVEYISAGCLTHSPPPVDIGLDIV